MTKFLPAGCKDVKINLGNAYRTTYTHIIAGDMIRIDWNSTGNGQIIPTPTHSPKRSFWAEVTEVKKVGRHVVITTRSGELSDFPHTSITRQERDSEHQARLDIDAAERAASVTASLQEVWEKKVADAKDLLDVIPCNDCTGGAANHSFGVAEDGFTPTVLCIGVAPATISSARAFAVSTSMRQSDRPERAVLGEPMCLGTFGAHGACIAVPGHLGLCMDAFGYRFDGADRAERRIPLSEIALGIQAITAEAATLTAECERCDWTAAKTWDQDAANASLDRHVREVHATDLEAEQDELRQLRMVAVRYATLVDALTAAQIGARQKLRELNGEDWPASSVAIATARLNAFDEVVAIADKVAAGTERVVPISADTKANLENISRRLTEGDALRKAVDRALENAKGRKAEASARSWDVPAVRHAYMRAEAAIDALESVNLWASRDQG